MHFFLFFYFIQKLGKLQHILYQKSHILARDIRHLEYLYSNGYKIEMNKKRYNNTRDSSNNAGKNGKLSQFTFHITDPWRHLRVWFENKAVLLIAGICPHSDISLLACSESWPSPVHWPGDGHPPLGPLVILLTRYKRASGAGRKGQNFCNNESARHRVCWQGAGPRVVGALARNHLYQIFLLR